MEKESKNKKNKEDIKWRKSVTREEFESLVERVDRIEKKLGIVSGK